jgi:hypothetical protein
MMKTVDRERGKEGRVLRIMKWRQLAPKTHNN